MSRATFCVSILIALTMTYWCTAEPLFLAPIGEHYKVLTVEKSENPQNIMMIYTQLDPNCHIAEKAGAPLFDFYWLMNGERFKPTHRMIKNAIRRHLIFEKLALAGKSSAFKVATKGGESFSPEVAASSLTVSSMRTKDGCEVETVLGTMHLDSFYGESRKSFKPPFRKMVAVTARGTDLKSGALVQKKYLMK